MSVEQPDFQAMSPAFWAFIDAKSLEEAGNILQQSPELLSEQIEKQLEHMIQDTRVRGQEKITKILEERRALLQTIKQSQKEEEIPEILQKNIQQAYVAYMYYQQNSNLQALNDAIEKWEYVLQHPDFSSIEENLRLAILHDSAPVYLQRYQAMGNLHDLDVALSHWQKCAEEVSSDSPYLPLILNNVGVGLRNRYTGIGNLSDLQAGIEAFQKAISFTHADSSDLPRYLNNVGDALRFRYLHTNDLSDLNASVEACQQAVSLTPEQSPDLSVYLTNLGDALRDRYGVTGNLDDLQRGTEMLRKAVSLTPENSPYRPIRLNDLGAILRDCYLQTSNLNDLHESIDAHQQAVKLTSENSPKLPSRLANLANALINRYSHTNNLSDLQKAIEILQKSITFTPEGSPDLGNILNSLATALGMSYLHTGNLSELQTAVETHKKVTSITPSTSPHMVQYLSNLDMGLGRFYSHTGDLTVLQTSIEALQQTIPRVPVDSPALPGCLQNLGQGLYRRYLHSGNLSDLQESIEISERVVKLTPENAVRFPMCLGILGTGLGGRYSATGNFADLQASIEAFQRAIELSPDASPYLPTLLSNLGQNLTTRYSRNSDIVDLENSIELLQQALNLAPDKSVEKPLYLNNLAGGLTKRYLHTNNTNDLEAGIECYQEAIGLTPETAPEFPGYLFNLANDLRRRYSLTGTPQDLQSGVEAYERAAKRGVQVSVETTLKSATNWLNWAFERQAWEEIERAYDHAYQATEKLLQIQLIRRDKETWLKNIQYMSGYASYAFVKRGKIQDAVVAQERWLARLLSESLAIDHADLTRLEATGNTELSSAYRQAVEQWHSLTQQTQLTKKNYADLRDAREQLNKTIERIQQIQGYERFLASPNFTDIQTVAKDRAIVYVMITDAGGLALIVQDNVTPIWLPELTTKSSTKLLTDSEEGRLEGGYMGHYLDWRHNPYEKSTCNAWYTTLENTGRWLWQVIMQPLREALSEDIPITIIPGGGLSLLPLHAAWTEDASMPTGRRYVIDELTISYAPNARALAQAKMIVERVSAETLLAVDDPQPVTANILPHSKYEVQTIASMFADKGRQIFKHEYATRHAVLEAITDHTVLHCSCHGTANLHDPLNSGLAMAHDELLSLQDLLDSRFDGVRLATLSACETSIPGTELPAEVINLPSGLLQAGVAGVVGSLWSVSDLSTMMLMTKFYDLWRRKQFEPSEALRQAQIWVRDSTNQEKLDYFESKDLPIHTRNPKLAEELIDKLHERIGFRDPDAHDFAHPFHWAAFQYVGA